MAGPQHPITGKTDLFGGPDPGIGDRPFLQGISLNKVINGEEHALDLVVTGTLGSGEGVVGVNVVVFPQGTAGQWASAFFGKVHVKGNALPGTGYCSGAELEVQYDLGITPSDIWILNLNSSNNASMSPGSAYICTHQYGTARMLKLLNLYDESVAAAHDSGRMVVETSAIPAVNDANWVMVRCRVGGTDVWIPATKTAPAA